MSAAAAREHPKAQSQIPTSRSKIAGEKKTHTRRRTRPSQTVAATVCTFARVLERIRQVFLVELHAGLCAGHLRTYGGGGRGGERDGAVDRNEVKRRTQPSASSSRSLGARAGSRRPSRATARGSSAHTMSALHWSGTQGRHEGRTRLRRGAAECGERRRGEARRDGGRGAGGDVGLVCGKRRASG